MAHHDCVIAVLVSCYYAYGFYVSGCASNL